MKKKLSIMILSMAVIFILLPSFAYGDVGPKPSVVISFQGLEGKTYYATLLSEISSTGPYSAVGSFHGDVKYSVDDEDYEIWEKFAAYEDEDGYYFLQYFKDCTQTSQFKWGYYPPQKFKVLVYFPDLDSFAVSEIYDQYAFDSYYKLDMTNIELEPQSRVAGLKAVKDYDYTWELVSLFIRIIATIGIEILIAWIYGYRHKNQLGIIVKTNIGTQTLLNILLNTVNYFLGGLAFLLSYILMEVLVFAIEASAYSALLPRYGRERLAKKSYAVFYALIANAASFYLGWQIAKFIPGIF